VLCTRVGRQEFLSLSNMNWETIAADLADVHRPALVVDGGRGLRFANAPMVELLGHSLDELSGQGWLAACVLPADRHAVGLLLAAGLRGQATAGDLPVVTRAGRRLHLLVGLTREMRGRARALVVFANDVRGTRERSEPTGDCWCDVSRLPKGRTIVKALRFLDPAIDPEAYVGVPPQALLDKVAAGANLVPVNAVLEGRSAHAEEVCLSEAADVFRIVSAIALDDATVRVKIRCVSAQLLPEMVEAKVARLADSSGLSDRERQVLTLLLRGRGVEDISTILEIAPRTVKFHQANVLQKLGADSRLDLLRVVL